MKRTSAFAFDPVAEGLAELRRGRMVIVVDDEARENEGDFILAAEKVTPEAINFLTKHARGLICVALPGWRLDELGLAAMVQRNTAKMGTPFTVSVDALEGTTTGISAHDRARTVQVLVDARTTREDLAIPGHIFPLRALDEGVLRRAGHTEAAIDLARLAGLYPAGVLCEVLDEDGSMARPPRLREIARAFGMKLLSIGDLITYRRERESLVTRITTTRLPTPAGEFRCHLYRSAHTGEHHIALVMGHPERESAPLVRIHSQCLTGDVFGSQRCDCGLQLREAMRHIAAEGHGVIVYMRQEGRQIGLANKLRAYALQDQGMDTVEANEALGFPPDPRDYGVGAQILSDLGLSRLRLLTNNPRKIVGLEAYGLQVVSRLPIEVEPTERNRHYLATKRSKLGHLLEKVGPAEETAAGEKRAGEPPILAAAEKTARSRAAARARMVAPGAGRRREVARVGRGARALAQAGKKGR
jgi:3,4-dihydroxy 2-butanone 4-phosphate synthase / GTP cyclohydrolase II